MGLFMNEDQHPELFKNTKDVQAKNQGSYQYDAWKDFLLEQKRDNEEVQRALQLLKQLNQRQEHKQEGHWQEIDVKIRELKQINVQREALEKSALGFLEKIEDRQQNGEEVFQQIQLAQAEMTQRLEKIEGIEQQVLTQLENRRNSQDKWQEAMDTIAEQTTKQQELQQQINNQFAQQEDVMGRLEKQEALSEKIIREIQQIRSAIFERASYLAEKIEHGYKRTSTYLQKFVSTTPEEKKEAEHINK